MEVFLKYNVIFLKTHCIYLLMIIIADAHAGVKNGLGPEFLDMLKALENSTEDLVFLGDIFDLWIAFPRYEKALHREFVSWCRGQKERRKIYFVEGNHEFFVDLRRRAAFTAYNDSLNGLQLGKFLFVHGDRVNSSDKNYLRFHRVIKSGMVNFFVKFTPCGPKIAHYFKESLQKTNHNFRKYIPIAEIMTFAQKTKNLGIEVLFMGHFHHGEIIETDGLTVCMVPDWYKTRQVAHFDPACKQIKFLHWQEAVTR